MKKYILIGFCFLGSQPLECADQNPRPVAPAPTAPVAPFVLPQNPRPGTWAHKAMVLRVKRTEEAEKAGRKTT